MATILGLLLVVTFVANYLTTTLPQYMSVNDINHNLLVENEAGRMAALLREASAQKAVDAQLSQPFVLGSAGLPPFAASDGGAIGPVLTGSQETVKFGLTGTTPGLVDQVSVGAGVVVQMHNTYAPAAQVAFDYGAVIFTQYGGIPTMIDPPPISITASAATIWLPIFSPLNNTEGGTGTAILQATLTAVSTQTFPAGGFTITGGKVTLTLVTPFAAAWMAYFAGSPSFAGDATCAPAGATVCSTTGTFINNGALGTITLVLPVSGVTLTVATFTIGLT